MTTTPDPIITFDAADWRAAYEAVANEVDAFGFDAETTDTGGGVVCVTVPLGGDRTLVFGGMQDGFLVMDVEVGGQSATDGDGWQFTIADAIAALLVQRVNTDNLPA